MDQAVRGRGSRVAGEAIDALEERGDAMRAVHGADGVGDGGDVGLCGGDEEGLLAGAAEDRDGGDRALEAALGDADDVDGGAEGGVEVRAEAGAAGGEPDVAVDDDH